MINWIQQTLLRRKRTDKGRMTLEKLKEEYRDSDVCMGEMLLSMPADGLSIEDAFELSVAAKNGRTATVFTGLSMTESRKNCKRPTTDNKKQRKWTDMIS